MTEVRHATAADAIELAALSGQLGYPAASSDMARRVQDVMAHGGVVLVAVDARGQVCGFAHARRVYSLITERYVDLAALVVDAEARGQGVGKALLAAVEAWACEQHFACVRVRSNLTRERAHRFYLREGYAEHKRQAVFSKSLSRVAP